MACWVDSPAPQGATGTVQPDPKPPKRHRASGAQQKRIAAAFEFAVCCHCSMRPVERHHAVSRARGGSDVVENLIPVCRLHHQMFEDHAPGWEQVGASMRSYICSRSDRWAHVLGCLGEDLFDRTYPSVTRVCTDRLCVLPDGHSGAHLSLAAREFQSRSEPYFSPRESEERQTP